MHLTLKSNDTLCFSIIVTGKCNASCSYCHFYKRHDKKSVDFDIDPKLFKLYLQFISFIRHRYHHKIQVRFSGGEPLLLGTRLFALSRGVHSEIGLKPYVLTNGEKLNHDVIGHSVNNCVAAYLVSLENPFEIDSGAVSPSIAMEKIRKHDGAKIAVKPGVLIAKNHMFSHISDICDFFYSQIQMVPPISEMNFADFHSPSDSELVELERNIYKVVQRYFGKTELNLFPYIVPELANCYQGKYLVELDLDNSLNITKYHIERKGIAIVEEYLNMAYPLSGCNEVSCDCYPNCLRIKWVWKDKMDSYCRMKRRIFDAYYKALTKVST